MRILVYGAGVIGSILAARLHEARHDVSLVARGERLAALRDHGVLLAEAESPAITRVPVAVLERPAGRFDLIAVCVRSHQVDAVLESVAQLEGDVLFLVNWAAGPAPLEAAIGRGRVLLGFPGAGGTMEGEVVRTVAASLMTRLVSMPVGELDGASSPRLTRVVETLRSGGFNAKPESRMDAWLTTHAAFEVPLGRSVQEAGSPLALAADSDAIRNMVRVMRGNLQTLPSGPVPRAFTALRRVPEGVLVPVFRRFLRSSVAAALETSSAAVSAELAFLAGQLAELVQTS